MLTYLKFITTTLFFLYTTSYAEERRYISHDVAACTSVQFNCKSQEEAFFDRQGCGCQSHDLFQYNYINYDVESCLTFIFDCEAGEYPFFNQKGCGCREPISQPECHSAIDSNYRQVKLTDAGITFTIPRTWKQEEDKLLWSLDDNATVQFGFQWKKVESEWQPEYILPENSTVLESSLLNLAWEYGLSYLVRIDNLALLEPVKKTQVADTSSMNLTSANQKNSILIDSMLAIEINSNNATSTEQPAKPQTDHKFKIASTEQSHQIVLTDVMPIMSGRPISTMPSNLSNVDVEEMIIDRSPTQLKQFAKHLLIFRVETSTIYDFYLQASQLGDLQKQEIEFQQVVRSGHLNSIKEYVSQDLLECQAIHLQCQTGKLPFVDDLGCGCITNAP